MTGLRAKFTSGRGDFRLDADLAVHAGETLALVGPNGSGKSTLLATLAGLVPLQDGSIRLGGELLADAPTNIELEPEHRGVGVVFQDALLFPNVDVLANVSFGPRARGASRAEAQSAALRCLEQVGMTHKRDARVDQLSGGEAQRVALARALATRPRLLLLDEALASVDARARIELRRELQAVLRDFEGICILVAHDAVDAFALADRVAVLEEGRVIQSGTVAEICGGPRSPYVADLVGLNLLRGTMHGREFHGTGGGVLVTAADLEGEVLAAVHPRAVALYRERPSGSPRNVWQTQVEWVEVAGDRLRVRFVGPLPLVAEITPPAAEELGVREGETLWLALKATEIAVYSA